MIFAYSRVYRELAALLDQADRRGVTSILFTDTLAPKLCNRIDLILPVARGRADMLSMHTCESRIVLSIDYIEEFRLQSHAFAL